MGKGIVIIIGALLLSLTGFAQHQVDSIVVKKSIGTVFMQNGMKLKPKQLLEITKVDPQAYKEMKAAKTNYDISAVFGAAGGFLVGWPLGAALAGGQPNWTLAAIGAGLIGVAIPFTSSYVKQAKNAVQMYNSSLKQTGSSIVDFSIGFTGNGIGIKLVF